MTWSRIVSDPIYLEYFREFLRLNEQRLITLHREIRKFRSAVPITTTGSATTAEEKDNQNEDHIREQLLYSALSNVSEITKDTVNVTKRTNEELNGEAQKNYSKLW